MKKAVRSFLSVFSSFFVFFFRVINTTTFEEKKSGKIYSAQNTRTLSSSPERGEREKKRERESSKFTFAAEKRDKNLSPSDGRFG